MADVLFDGWIATFGGARCRTGVAGAGRGGKYSAYCALQGWRAAGTTVLRDRIGGVPRGAWRGGQAHRCA
jgi:hypothetical protein